MIAATPMRIAAVVALALALAACGASDEYATAGGVTANEATALDDAAEMLEQQRLPQEALQPGGTQTPGPDAKK